MTRANISVAARHQPLLPFLLAALMALSLVVQAGLARADDGVTLRSLVEGQIAAFRSGDATTAYSYAAPKIRKMFPTPDRFMRMVERGYPPVVAPRAVSFGRLRDTARGPVQEVYLTDAGGTDWLALYTFEQQGDGSWKISGCVLTKSPGASA
jgi:hypothetical protein